jgi:homospermidine synthase
MTNRVAFNGRILVLGFGGVSQCTLPLLLKHLDVPREKITILDMVENPERLRPILSQGVRFVQDRIQQERLAEQLASQVGPGDLIIDLAWNIACTDLLNWCHQHDVMYVNTSVEVWNPYDGAEEKPPTERTLYARHMDLRRMMKRWRKTGATAVLDHGANPGLVSHFTKTALVDLAQKLISEKPDDPRRPALEQALAADQFNRLAQLTGVKAIHISERDTQVSSRRRKGSEFANTWSVEGFYEEGIAPAEMGWGTHERVLPPDAHHHQEGPRNQICLERYGMNTFVRSRVPSSEIVGMVIRHGEAFSISEYLTVTDDAGRAVYRPTVHYAYLPCDYAVASLEELREQNYEMHASWRIMQDEIVSGYDELGVLLMGHDFNSWWAGTILEIDEARRRIPGQNATTLQVAASVLGAVLWMIRNPRHGVLLPDALPHREILDVAAPYLGKVVSIPIDWVPPVQDPTVADGDPWQFVNFLIEPLSRPARRRPKSRPMLVREYCDPFDAEFEQVVVGNSGN